VALRTAMENGFVTAITTNIVSVNIVFYLVLILREIDYCYIDMIMLHLWWLLIQIDY
jgi:hypothetical protein